MLRYLPVIVVIGVTIYALIECIQTPEDEVRNLPKVFWIILILLFDIIGSIAWFVAGRAQGRAGPVPRSRPGQPPRAPRPPRGPDDDPDFLRKL